jgi:hypothetical protein
MKQNKEKGAGKDEKSPAVCRNRRMLFGFFIDFVLGSDIFY